MTRPIYLDHHATTPLDPEVFEAMRPYFLERFGNPSSRHHSYGWEADEAVEKAREQVAELIGGPVGGICFTSGATESNNLAIKSTVTARADQGDHIVTISTEHSSVLESCRRLGREGFRVTSLPVEPSGLIDLGKLRSAVTPGTLLVSVMHANNEIGVIQPLQEISQIAHGVGALFHTDAAQSFGKIPFDVRALDIDLASLSAHKMYGPKGTGALYLGPRAMALGIQAQMDGGHQERGLRSGTLNTPGIVGFGASCALAAQRMISDARELGALRDTLQRLLQSGIPDIQIHGGTAPRLPHSLCLGIDGVDEERLFNELPGFAVSNGSACRGASRKISHVMKALGQPEGALRATVRFGLGRSTAMESIQEAATAVIQAVSRLRKRVR